MERLPRNLFLKQFELGPMQNFLYLLGDEESKEMAVVDPAWDVKFLCQQAKAAGFNITCVFLTHGHPDHVNGLDDILNNHDVPVYISRHEAPFYKPHQKNMVEVENHQKLKIGTLAFECILTPGHTPGCQCFLYQNVLISGDTIFIDGCGRCDLPGSDAKKMYHSLHQILAKLPDDTLLFPGHNYGPVPFATLGEQKQTNPYLRPQELNEFLLYRMGVF